MDRHFGRRGMWLALGVLALVFLCTMTCIGAAALLSPRGGGVWVQAPAGEGSAMPPAVYYPGHGIWTSLGAGVGLLFKLLFFGLLILLLLKLVGRLFWCRWHAVPPYGYGPWGSTPQGAPEGGAEGSDPGTGGEPPAWARPVWRHHRHRHPWGPPPWWESKQPAGPAPQAGPEVQAEAGEAKPDAPTGQYSGPME
jgi:hypothetical protein